MKVPRVAKLSVRVSVSFARPRHFYAKPVPASQALDRTYVSYEPRQRLLSVRGRDESDLVPLDCEEDAAEGAVVNQVVALVRVQREKAFADVFVDLE